MRIYATACHSIDDECRDFVVGDLVPYARRNPGTLINVQAKPYRHPTILASYRTCPSATWPISPVAVNGRSISVSLKNMPAQDVLAWAERARGLSGCKVRAFPRTTLTHRPSIQGSWNPFTHA